MDSLGGAVNFEAPRRPETKLWSAATVTFVAQGLRPFSYHPDVPELALPHSKENVVFDFGADAGAIWPTERNDVSHVWTTAKEKIVVELETISMCIRLPADVDELIVAEDDVSIR